MLLLLACTPGSSSDSKTTDTSAIAETDADGDGFGTDDCDDGDAEVSPAAEEICDGRDNDCDDAVDEDLLLTWYDDDDGDGFGDPATAHDACESDGVNNPDDCDDAHAEAFPDGPEICDGLDNDCDGAVDQDVTNVYYADADGDGFGDAAAPTDACAAPEGWVEDASDCDDSRTDKSPAATEVCDEHDNDCDGTVDDGVLLTFAIDLDGDGWGDASVTQDACVVPTGYAEADGDCDDSDAAWHPGADESDCTDPNDYNCDGSVGWADDDADGWAACEDCNDADGAVNPDGTEICNDFDDDCDGTIDEPDAIDASLWYVDYDGDGYGSSKFTETACEQPADYVANADDCDDTESGTHPDAVETCDGTDEDCDGDIDEDATDVATWYLDADGDGFGDVTFPETACDAPADFVADASDCDDADDTIHPDAGESCNGYDDDCDGSIDEEAPGATWYADTDGDGFGAPDVSVEACDAPADFVAGAGDCDDDDALVVTVCDELGDGRDGDLSGSLDLTGDDGVAWLVTGTVGLTTAVESVAGFAEGDDVLLISMQGAGAGAWEVLELAAVGSADVTFATPPTGTYDPADTVVIQRIPQYQDLTVSGALTVGAWDTMTSATRQTGIVAVKVRGDLAVTGSVDADGLGFAGGCGGGPEGAAGLESAGGGAGGGGGWADGGTGGGTGTGGTGASSCSNVGGVGGAGGGGGGGKITHCAGGSPCRGGGGGGGGGAYVAALNESSADLTALLLGGGGSAGAEGGSSGGGSAGGAGGGEFGRDCGGGGGGIVLVWARTLTVSGSVTAVGKDGGTGEDGEDTHGCGYDDGAGGGGAGGEGAAGGSIRLACITCDFVVDSVLVTGGAGGGGGRGGHGWPGGRGGGAGGASGSAGDNGTYAADGGASGGGGAGGEAGMTGVIAVFASTVNGYGYGSADADLALDDATGGELAASGGFGP